FHHVELSSLPVRNSDLTPIDLRPIPTPSGPTRTPKGGPLHNTPMTAESDSEIEDGWHMVDGGVSIEPGSAETNSSARDHVPAPRAVASASSGDQVCAETQSATAPTQPAGVIPVPAELGVERNLIPRPSGQAGRPGRKGYNLQKCLGWSKSVYNYVKEWVNKEVDTTLNCELLFNAQKPQARIIVRRALHHEKMQFLKNYADCWPIEELIKARLLYRRPREKVLEGVRAVRRE
ncbi:hypothetical protein K525DRAFT_158380, partial [Schizophyllum commune Loenen D]